MSKADADADTDTDTDAEADVVWQCVGGPKCH